MNCQITNNPVVDNNKRAEIAGRTKETTVTELHFKHIKDGKIL